MTVLYFHICRVVFRQRNFRLQHVPAKKVEESAITNENSGVLGRKTAGKEDERDNQRLHRSRVTVMFLVITTVFAISFIPRVVLLILKSVKHNIYAMNDGVQTVVLLLYSVYIMNNVVNPFIYGCLDKKFQAELRKICRCGK